MTFLSSGAAGASASPVSPMAPLPSALGTRRPAAGVGGWYSSQVDALLRDSGAWWYHTWAPHHDWITTPEGCEFVPTIARRTDVTAARLQQATTHGGTLLGFDKPDKSGANSLSPTAALSLWPQLEGTGLRLGAPAVSSNAQARRGWLDSFMSGAVKQRRRVDFIPLHWYPSPSALGSSDPVGAAVNELRQYLQAVHGRFGLPLWLTELSVVAWGSSGQPFVPQPAVQAAFLAEADSMMTALPYVERWAWFSLTPFSGGGSAPLYDDSGSVTQVGDRFRTISAAGAAEEDPAPGSATAPGVGAWYTSKVDTLLRDSGTPWYYTWAPHHDWITTPAGCEFVPMIWGTRDVNPTGLQQAKANGTTLLGFNEPDESWQDNSLSPAAAQSLWPQLEATGLRLGAPGVATRGHVYGGWLDSFMSGLAKQKGRVDFIPLHWYSSPALLTSSKNVVDAAVNDLGQYLEAVHQRYGLPLWLTEFALIGWTADLKNNIVPAQTVQADFLAAAASMMDGLSYVERWAWFSLTQYDMSPGASLYDANNKATLAGERFRSIAAVK